MSEARSWVKLRWGFAEKGEGWTFLHEKHWEIHLILNGSSLDVHLVNQRAFMIM
jgi:hypothetical protein